MTHPSLPRQLPCSIYRPSVRPWTLSLFCYWCFLGRHTDREDFHPDEGQKLRTRVGLRGLCSPVQCPDGDREKDRSFHPIGGTDRWCSYTYSRHKDNGAVSSSCRPWDPFSFSSRFRPEESRVGHSRSVRTGSPVCVPSGIFPLSLGLVV